MPGQFGPTNLVFPCVFRISVMRTISVTVSIGETIDMMAGFTMLRNSFCNAADESVWAVLQEKNLRTHQTTNPISASMASSIPLAASGGLLNDQQTCSAHGFKAGLVVTAYGTNIAEAVAPVSFTASRTLAKTGLPRCVDPAFLGFVPPTTFVPATD